MTVFEELTRRGLIAQMTHPEKIRELLDHEKVTFYIGFDATADSLHVGHFLQMVVMKRLQQAGHRPIALLGTGTTMVGDPTGKTEMRKMLTPEIVDHNVDCIKQQMSRFLDFSDGKALIVNNADWLRSLNYIDFLREVGVHFSVNRMLTAECYKQRMERGLTFLEFNYMIMQSYDFLELFKRYGCTLQAGGDDQWSNMLSGADLIRRKEQKPAFALTFKLLLTSDGRKMGKTEKGALWLDPNRTSPYEFYQYWRNVDDADVEKCLALLTFLPMDEVRRLGALKDAAINEAKRVLAFEVTKLIHGEEEAVKARDAAEALFGGGAMGGSVPTTALTAAELAEESRLVALLARAGLCKSNGEARKTIQQGGVTVNDEKVTDVDFRFTPEMLSGEGALVRKGKKSYHRFKLA